MGKFLPGEIMRATMGASVVKSACVRDLLRQICHFLPTNPIKNLIDFTVVAGDGIEYILAGQQIGR
jgi:hypothetical protein